MTSTECLRRMFWCCKPCKKNYDALAEDDELKTTKNNVPLSLEIPAVLTAGTAIVETTPTGTDNAPVRHTTAQGFDLESQTRPTTVATTPPPTPTVVSPAPNMPLAVPTEVESVPAFVAATPTVDARARHHTAQGFDLESQNRRLAVVTTPESTVDGRVPQTEPAFRSENTAVSTTTPACATLESTTMSQTTPRVRTEPRDRRGRPHRRPPVNIDVRTPNSVASGTRARSPLGFTPRSLSYQRPGDGVESMITPTKDLFEDPKKK